MSQTQSIAIPGPPCRPSAVGRGRLLRQLPKLQDAMFEHPAAAAVLLAVVAPPTPGLPATEPEPEPHDGGGFDEAFYGHG